MFEVITAIITKGNYDLEKLLHKIDILYAEDKLDDAQRKELIRLAREKADPHAAYGDWKEVTDGLLLRIVKMEERLDKIEKGTAQPEPEPQDEWPEYVPPTGSHNAYMKGDKITFKGKHYISLADNCVYSPWAWPSKWKLVE